MKNSADLGGCYPPRPSASVDDTLLDLKNSSYPTQPHSIIAKYYIYIYRCKGDWVEAYNYAGILLEESLWSKVNVVYRNISYKLLGGLQLKIFHRVYLNSSRYLKERKQYGSSRMQSLEGPDWVTHGVRVIRF